MAAIFAGTSMLLNTPLLHCLVIDDELTPLLTRHCFRWSDSDVVVEPLLEHSSHVYWDGGELGGQINDEMKSGVFQVKNLRDINNNANI